MVFDTDISAPGKAFVTGGTGFIGINLVRLLVENGWDVTVLHRPTSDLVRLDGLPLHLREGSVTDPASVEQAVPEGTEVVFHLAGSTNMWSERNAAQTAVNVAGTRHMVEAAAASGAKVFVHTSSVSAWGRQKGHVTENTPQKGGESWVNYEYSKWAGEREALKGMELGMKVVILNPTQVVGPYDTSNWGRLFFALRDGDLPAIPGGDASVAHVAEVAKAHLRAVDRGKNGHRYLLSGDDCTFPALVRAIAGVSGIAEEELPPRVPDFVLRAAGRLQVLKARFTGREPVVTPELAYLMTRRSVTYASDKAVRELGYTIVPMEQAVRDCHAWLTEEGLL